MSDTYQFNITISIELNDVPPVNNPNRGENHGDDNLPDSDIFLQYIIYI